MTFATLVRRNVLDPVRSRSIWVLLGLFALVFGLMGYLLGGNVGGGFAWSVAQIMAGLGPLAALGFSYDSIAGPRESGSLRVMLSYPYTRRDLVLGTLTGRVLVLGLTVVVGLVAGALSTLVFGGTLTADLLPIALLSLLLTTTTVAIAVGISASVSTSARAAITAFGAYLLFSGFWSLVPSGIRYLLNGLSFPQGPPPEWTFVWNQLNPLNAFRTATAAIVDTPISSAFYHGAAFALAVLVGWFVLSTVVGVLRFERTDL